MVESICRTDISLVPRPCLKEGKGLVHIEHFLGRTGCSISCDWYDNASFWHGNASTTLTRVLYTAMGRCHMIITCKPHGVNLIGALEFLTNRKRSMCTSPFPSLRVGSGNETKPISTFIYMYNCAKFYDLIIILTEDLLKRKSLLL